MIEDLRLRPGDARWWQRVFAALPRGYSVVAFDVGLTRPLGDVQLVLAVDDRRVGVYEWRLAQIAKRHTHAKPAAAALARAVRRAERSERALANRPGLRGAAASGVTFDHPSALNPEGLAGGPL